MSTDTGVLEAASGDVTDKENWCGGAIRTNYSGKKVVLSGNLLKEWEGRPDKGKTE